MARPHRGSTIRGIGLIDEACQPISTKALSDGSNEAAPQLLPGNPPDPAHTPPRG